MELLAEDIDRIMLVMETAFDPTYGEAWTRRQVEDAMLVGNCRYQLIDSNGRPPVSGKAAAGFTLSRRCLDEEELLLIGVDPQQRRKGLGQTLLLELTRDARAQGIRRILLEMRKGNPAETLYRAFGFAPIGERENYYRTTNGERIDAVTFAYAVE